MQTVHCTHCRAKVFRLRQVSAASRKPLQAVRSGNVYSSGACKQRRRCASTVTCSHEEDKQAEASKQSQFDKSKQDREDKNTRYGFDNGEPDDDDEDLGIFVQTYHLSLANFRVLKHKLSARQDWQELGSSIIGLVGLPGCIVVSLGYILHLDPYGHLHWSPLDFCTGLVCAIPSAVYDLILMLPKFQVQGVRDQAKPNTPSQEGSTASPPSQEEDPPQTASSLLSFLTLRGVQKERTTDIPAVYKTPHPEPGVLPRYSYGDTGSQSDWNVSREAVRSWQLTRTLVDPGFDLLLPLEVIIIVLENLVKQMQSSAIILTGLAGFLTDRILHIKGLNLVPSLLNPSLSPAANGKWAALAAIFGLQFLAVLGAAFSRVPSSPQDPWNAKDSLAYDPATRLASDKETVALVAQFLQKDVKRKKGEAIINISRNMLETAFVGSSFIITSNLLAPITAKVSQELLFSLLKRAKYWQLQQTTLLRKI